MCGRVFEMFKWILIDQANVQIYDIFTRKETYFINGNTFKAKELESIFYGSDYDKYELGQISERKLISNFLKRTKLDGSGFRKYFQYIIISAELGLKKPDKAFYEKALQIIKANAEECLFIDDKKKNCLGAEAIGIKSIVFKDAKQLRKELIRLGIV